MKQNKIMLIFVLIFLLCTSVFGGSLASVSTLNIKSDYENIAGNSIVVSWISTPSASDYLELNNALLPDGYTLTEPITIDVKQPKFNQEFEVFNSYQVRKLSYHKNSFFFANWWGVGKDSDTLCTENLNKYISENYPNKKLLEGTTWKGDLASNACHIEYVLIDEQTGWVGELTHTGWEYTQDIVIEKIGTLTLQSNKEQTQLTNSLGKTAVARLLNFGSWFNSELSDNNVYAFHSKTTKEGDWKPVYLSDQFTGYQSNLREIKNYMNDLSTPISDLQRSINILNTISTEIKSSGTPSFWSNGDLSKISRAGNTLSVPIKQDVLTSNIQLVLKGTSVGLIVPIGKPKINFVETGFTITERGAYNLDYEVTNTGNQRASFFLQVFCGEEISSQRITLSNVDPKKIIKDSISISAKDSALSGDVSKTCKLRMTETTTNAFDEKQFLLTIQQKANCVNGEQTAPYITADNKNYVVNILNDKCDVIQSISCPVDGKEFVLKSGSYSCVDKAGSGGNGSGDDGFKLWLFVTTIILSVIGFIISFNFLDVLSKFEISNKPVGKIIQIVISFGIFILIFILVPIIIRGITNLFIF